MRSIESRDDPIRRGSRPWFADELQTYPSARVDDITHLDEIAADGGGSVTRQAARG
jgi:hypothetical protein